MEYRKLGTTDLDVSLICLGTMTFGEQNTEAEGHEQMDYALDQGINIFDTAELYSIPPKAETQGSTERIIGTWFQNSGKRSDVILATKVVGRSPHMPWFRGKDHCLDRANIEQALEDSLKRLNTDYIDLYQLHWPDRAVNNFGTLDFHGGMYDAKAEEDILNVLHILQDQIKAGKIRYVGLSNETPWGTMTFLQLAEKHGLPMMQSVQNQYNLLSRTYDSGMAEVSMHTKCGLLAYSPLARGRLTGKYLGGRLPPGSSKTMDKRQSRYDKPRSVQATQDYVAIAEQHGLDAAQMAIAYVNTKPYVTTNIIGATSMEQLKTNIAAIDLTLSDEVITAIDNVHKDNPNPSEN